MTVEKSVLAKRLSVNRLAITGALVTVLLFVFCWAAAVMGLVASHAFVALFTLAPVVSLTALGIGSVSAALFGGAAGAAVAVFYNLLGARVD